MDAYENDITYDELEKKIVNTLNTVEGKMGHMIRDVIHRNTNMYYYLLISPCAINGSIRIMKHHGQRDNNRTFVEVERFRYYDWNMKVNAYKKALLWLLSKSKIGSMVGREAVMTLSNKVYKVKIIEEV